MSARSWPANTLGFPAAALLTNLLKISPHAEGRQLIHQAHKNNNLRPPPPPKEKFSAGETGQEEEGGHRRQSLDTEKTEAFEAGHGHMEHSAPTWWDAAAPGRFCSWTRKGTAMESSPVLQSSLPG